MLKFCSIVENTLSQSFFIVQTSVILPLFNDGSSNQ